MTDAPQPLSSLSADLSPSSSLLANLRQELMRHPPFAQMQASEVDFFLSHSRQNYFAPEEILIGPESGIVKELFFIRQGAVIGERGLAELSGGDRTAAAGRGRRGGAGSHAGPPVGRSVGGVARRHGPRGLCGGGAPRRLDHGPGLDAGEARGDARGPRGGAASRAGAGPAWRARGDVEPDVGRVRSAPGREPGAGRAGADHARGGGRGGGATRGVRRDQPTHRHSG